MGCLRNKRFAVVTLGCRANHYEAEAIVSMMEKEQAIFASERDSALDAVIFVTCTITKVADNKTRKLLRRFRRLHPKAAIVACGCYAQGAPAAEAAELGVDLLVGNRLKHRIPKALGSWFAGAAGFIELREDVSQNDAWEALALDYPRIHTRAFIKVQDGCAHGCSYCVVPQVRGKPVSRDPEDVVREAERVVAGGCREIVLTGVHLGSYRYKGMSLAGLIRSLSVVGGLSRLRLGSLEPFSLNDELLEAFAESRVFCRHLHLPLQSGDDAILRLMRRGYTARRFAEIVRRAGGALGNDVHFSTDLIAGFPGESEEAFGNSMALVEELGFGKLHVFPFSPRKGTDAASMEGTVSPAVVKKRAAAALALSDRLLAAYASRWVGREVEILAENIRGGVVSGWSRHYIRVLARAGGYLPQGSEVTAVPSASVRGMLLEEGINSDHITSELEEI